MNYMAPNPYYAQFQNGIVNPYPNYYTAAMQQIYNPQAQQQAQQQQQQNQQITTQPPIMQPQANIIGSKILPVTNKEEATVAPVDLVQGTPSFFFNKSNGEIYLKQFDVPTGTAIFKIYTETKQVEEPHAEAPHADAVNYEKELNYLIQGVDNLHRMIAQLHEERIQYPAKVQDFVEDDVIDIKPEQIEEYSKPKTTKKRGQ